MEIASEQFATMEHCLPSRGLLSREGFATAMRTLGAVDVGGMRTGLQAGLASADHYLELGVIDGEGQLRN